MKPFVLPTLPSKLIGFVSALVLLSASLVQAQPVQLGYDCAEPLIPKYDKKVRLYGYVGFNGQWVVPASFVQAGSFEGQFALIQQGTKYGIINCEGKITAAAIYDNIFQFQYGRGWGKRNGKWGLFDAQGGRDLVPPVFDALKPVHPRRSLTWFQRNEKWGLFDKDLVRYVIGEKYDGVTLLSDSMAAVRSGNQYGIYDYSEGKIVLDQIIRLKPISRQHWAVFRQGKWGVLLLSGRAALAPQYDSVSWQEPFLIAQSPYFSGVYAPAGKPLFSSPLSALGPVSEGWVAAKYVASGMWGYLHSLLARHVAPQFSAAGPVQDSISIVTEASTGKRRFFKPHNQQYLHSQTAFVGAYRSLKNHLLVGIDNKGGHYLLNRQGQKMSIIAADTFCLDDTMSAIRTHGPDGWRLVNTFSGNVVSGPIFWKTLAAGKKGYYPAQDANGWTVVNMIGRPWSEARYDSLILATSGTQTFAQMWIKGSAGMMAENGTEVLPNRFLRFVLESSLVKAQTAKGDWGLYDLKGQMLADCDYDSLSTKDSHPHWPAFPARFAKGKKRGLLAANGKEVVAGYQSIDYVGEGLYAARKSAKEPVILLDGGGTARTPAATGNLEVIEPFQEGLAAARQNGLWGYLGTGGTWVIKPQYELVTAFERKAALVKKNGKWGQINQRNVPTLPFQYSTWKREAGLRILVL